MHNISIYNFLLICSALCIYADCSWTPLAAPWCWCCSVLFTPLTEFCDAFVYMLAVLSHFSDNFSQLNTLFSGNFSFFSSFQLKRFYFIINYWIHAAFSQEIAVCLVEKQEHNRMNAFTLLCSCFSLFFSTIRPQVAFVCFGPFNSSCIHSFTVFCYFCSFCSYFLLFLKTFSFLWIFCPRYGKQWLFFKRHYFHILSLRSTI